MAAFPLGRTKASSTPLAVAHGRTLAVDVRAAEDVPSFARSRVDGFAVVATDVVGATKEKPAKLAVVGEVAMGAAAPGPIVRGQAMRIPTGGALPRGADAAVMVEDTQESDGAVVVYDATDAAGSIKSDPAAMVTNPRTIARLYPAHSTNLPAGIANNA